MDHMDYIYKRVLESMKEFIDELENNCMEMEKSLGEKNES